LLTAGTIAGLLATIAGCGPTVFQGSTNVRIVGDAPAPPPPPPAPEPPPEPKRAQIVGNQIVINEKIQFAFDKADILSESHSILDEVVKIMTENPQVKKVRIEGHASLENDTPAARNHNKLLSDRRSKAVLEYLATHGIERGRLEAVGFGNEKPLQSNDTEEGREANRRVEFNILEVDNNAAKAGG
jgi:outer membrane protein OmpA-like peptidoglycan-associated protein